MKKLFNKIITISLTCLAMTSFVSAKQNVWSEGFAQGTTEYFIESGDYRLIISCTDKEDENASNSSIVVYDNKKSMSIKKANLEINGENYSIPMKSSSRVDTNNFIQLLEELKNNNAVIKFNGKTIVFVKNASNNIIPQFGKNFSCKTF